MNDKYIKLGLPILLINKLDILRKHESISRTQLIRNILNNYIKNKKRREAKSDKQRNNK